MYLSNSISAGGHADGGGDVGIQRTTGSSGGVGLGHADGRRPGGGNVAGRAALSGGATDDRRYLANNADALGGAGWDVKYPGVQILAAMALLQGKAGAHADVLRRYKQKADLIAC
nr:unnamed protein product [Digitaria exilis]